MLRPPFSQESIPINNWDVIVVGAGAAGLMTCLELPSNLKVLLLNRNTSKVSSRDGLKEVLHLLLDKMIHLIFMLKIL